MSERTDGQTEQPEGIDAGKYWQYLREIPSPHSRRDIVEDGLVQKLDEGDQMLSVFLDPDRCSDDEVFIELTTRIRNELKEGASIDRVRVSRAEQSPAPEPDPGDSGDGESSRPMTPLQAELMEEGKVPEPDPIGQSSVPPNVAPGAGYDGGEGPPPLEGPGGVTQEDAREAEYDGEMPVFQWEIDPRDPDADQGEAHLEEDDWEYRIWWQNHPEGLTYASLRALGADEADHDGEARPHAVGRAVVVNLVYDRDREGVVAVYGTTRDFRPFIDAFHRGFEEYQEDGD